MINFWEASARSSGIRSVRVEQIKRSVHEKGNNGEWDGLESMAIGRCGQAEATEWSDQRLSGEKKASGRQNPSDSISAGGASESISAWEWWSKW